jgi:hypothetical protein
VSSVSSVVNANEYILTVLCGHGYTFIDLANPRLEMLGGSGGSMSIWTCTGFFPCPYSLSNTLSLFTQHFHCIGHSVNLEMI